jgi:hypothetical protein
LSIRRSRSRCALDKRLRGNRARWREMRGLSVVARYGRLQVFDVLTESTDLSIDVLLDLVEGFDIQTQYPPLSHFSYILQLVLDTTVWISDINSWEILHPRIVAELVHEKYSQARKRQVRGLYFDFLHFTANLKENMES